MRSFFALIDFTAACGIGSPGTPQLTDAPIPIDAPATCLNGQTPGLGGPLNPNDGVGGGSSCGEGLGGSGSTPCIHQVGTDCMGECHGDGQAQQNNAPIFIVAGTLYADPGGNNPLGGAIIEVTVGGTTQQVVTANNGNFYIGGGSGQTIGNYSTKATQCLGTHSMSETQANGSCNALGCHDSTSANGRVYLVPGQP